MKKIFVTACMLIGLLATAQEPVKTETIKETRTTTTPGQQVATTTPAKKRAYGEYHTTTTTYTETKSGVRKKAKPAVKDTIISTETIKVTDTIKKPN